ncbi:hypothetical protein ASD11_08075 [Aeromicrobium sp. Root495]|nr:hypothetical protein ASD11_08075 [Aeromicrobium sp. Root495]
MGKAVVYARLADRSRSRAELMEALAKKHVPSEVAESLLDRFERAGLVDDAAFARDWVEGRQRVKGLASAVLRMELRRKGVDEELIDAALVDVDPDEERQAAHRLVQRKLRSVQGLDPSVQVRRLTGMLARKGYAPQVAFDVVREELEAETFPLESA